MSFTGKMGRENTFITTEYFILFKYYLYYFFSRRFLKIFWILIYLFKEHLIFFSLSVVGK